MKIIDNIDLKILLKYGFNRYPAPIKEYYKIVYFDNDKTKMINYAIKTNDRKIKIQTFNFDDHFNNSFYIDNTLYELMKDSLIEGEKYEK